MEIHNQPNKESSNLMAVNEPTTTRKAKYDVFDATSRSVPIGLPTTLKTPGTAAPFSYRKDFSTGCGPFTRSFLIRNVLTDDECSSLIKAAEETGFSYSDVAGEYPADYRNNERIICISKEMANCLWPRIQRYLTPADIENIAPYGFGKEGIWLPVHLNEAFMISRYNTGSFFKAHYDGMYKRNMNEASVFTVTIYLNDNFVGGEVNFLDENLKPTETFYPFTGTALIFNHDTLHEGSVVVSGTKYILRTGIMFRRVENLSDKLCSYENLPERKHVRSILASFDQLVANGDVKEVTSSFIELQAIQLSHGRCIRPAPPTSYLLPEILKQIFVRLSFKDLGRVRCTCKSWKYNGRDGIIWRELYIKQWNISASRLREISGESVDPGLIDWFGEFRDKITEERRRKAELERIAEEERRRKAESERIAKEEWERNNQKRPSMYSSYEDEKRMTEYWRDRAYYNAWD